MLIIYIGIHTPLSISGTGIIHHSKSVSRRTWILDAVLHEVHGVVLVPPETSSINTAKCNRANSGERSGNVDPT